MDSSANVAQRAAEVLLATVVSLPDRATRVVLWSPGPAGTRNYGLGLVLSRSIDRWIGATTRVCRLSRATRQAWRLPAVTLVAALRVRSLTTASRARCPTHLPRPYAVAAALRTGSLKSAARACPPTRRPFSYTLAAALRVRVPSKALRACRPTCRPRSKILVTTTECSHRDDRGVTTTGTTIENCKMADHSALPGLPTAPVYSRVGAKEARCRPGLHWTSAVPRAALLRSAVSLRCGRRP